MNKQIWWKQKLPLFLSSAFLLLTVYFFFWAWLKVFSFGVSHSRGEEVRYLSFLFGRSDTVSIFFILFMGLISIFGWLISTRVHFYQSRNMRIIYFGLTGLAIWGGIAAYGMSQAQKHMLPFFQTRLGNIPAAPVDTDGLLEQLVFGQLQGFYLTLVIIPVLIMFFTSYFLLNKYVEFDKDLNKAFFEFEWRGKWLQKLSKLEQKEKWPDIELGLSSTHQEMVVLPGRDRTLNTMIVGSIGTGKTAALGLPMINQDLHHMVEYIKNYAEMYEREDFRTEEVGGRFLSGISVIDPSNDLCQKTLQLVKAHNIPEEVITYINPLDPKTPSINAMRGPVDKVAEVFAQVIAGLNDSKDGGNFFFEQAQRNHLKHYIYLLKLHDLEKEVTLDMLLDMYNNPQLVHQMHVMLKATIPTMIDEIEDRDERNYWKIVQGIDEWFDLNLLPKVTRSGSSMVGEYGDDGETLYYDAKEEHVQGLRNILNDIGANPLIRRVLFGKSDFDFDRHMEIGGILLVNTAKGELVQLARVLGKVVLMNLQNATFRRLPNVSSFHHILIDEAPDYLYNSFREFPAQSRKYKVIITTLQQTIAQMADQFGEHYMTTLIGTMRNRMVYGDVPGYDAKYFSEMFGEKYTYEEGQTEMTVSPLQEDPGSRSGSSYSKVRDSSMTSGDIMFQEAFQCAVKLVVNNRPMPVVQIQANFVPKEEFSVASIQVEEDEANVWLADRRRYGVKVSKEVEIAIDSIEQTEVANQALYDKPVLDEAMVDRAIGIEVTKQPRSEIIYQSGVEKEVIVIPSLEEIKQMRKPVQAEPNQIRTVAAPTPVPSNTEQGRKSVLEELEIDTLDNQEQPVPEPVTPLVHSKNGDNFFDSILEPYSDDNTSAAPIKKGDYEQSELSENNIAFLKDIDIDVGKTPKATK
ncbi:type IV secretory system conjugative DNA transfer family protein [Psychrobacillus sp. FSL K6-4615]|uniref:type IV secretory system conjugative DNA transfer family protein n=1 Tax=Psychrobacillus sp. FSL K6-4615 TaxID=2921551 RepID=UPI0030F83926